MPVRCGHGFISIHALREESDQADQTLDQDAGISIHALREESDLRMGVSGGDRLISIHALREESDFTVEDIKLVIDKFQSTLSVRRATSVDGALDDIERFQSTLSVRRATVSHIPRDVT